MMPGTLDNWTHYVDAAKRQCLIAEYRVKSLEEKLGSPDPDQNTPLIQVQAHFEGVIVSVMAAVDKVAQAANSAFGLHLSQSELVNGAMTELGKRVPEMKDWFEKPIGLDLRRIRVRIIHYSYVKTPQQSEHQWQVEGADTDYTGSREILSYSRVAVAYGTALSELIPAIEPILTKG
ncbi:MAG: hypothetical protein EPO61_06205 [Nitrospirae bacterium]|nr:MAG: hypothetical protein EPO61_06205 [Nitrospirota bacterium]